MPKIIVNADDFGWDENRTRAPFTGILKSARIPAEAKSWSIRRITL